MANTLENKLIVSEPDFETIKANFKAFLRTQSTFTDYDFEGSGMSVLVDLLAYNTHYMSFYANMLANEAFLDTASLRDAVVSHAKMLGYTPSSRKSSVATINLTFTEALNPAISGMTALTLPRFTKFISTAINGVNYVFNTLNEVNVTKSGNAFTFTGVRVTEGRPVNYVFNHVENVNPTQEFIIPDADVDASTIEVIIQNSPVDLTQTTYTLATDATEVSSTSNVYYLDEINGGKYKIYFGDNVLGKKLSDGNVVIISYLISSGEVANKATGFKLMNSVGGLSSGTIAVTSVASGGAEAETAEKIKFTAPKSFVSNNRAVTKSDYVSLIQRKYPALQAVNVWGGEENVPPIYGKVFISAKPAAGYQISTIEKQYILNDIVAPMNIVTVTPEFVDPDYNYINISAVVNYDPTATTRTTGEVESVVKSAIRNYANTNFNTFNSDFRASKMLRAIDNIETAIQSSQIEVKIEKRLEPILNTAKNYVLDYHTALKKATGKSRIYSTPAYTAYDEELTYRKFFFEEVPESSTGISSIDVLVPGLGFTAAPTVVIQGDGVGATATATITNGKITSVTIDNPGSDYTTAIAKLYNGTTEITTALLKVNATSKIGKMRTFYYNDSDLKVIYNSDAGTIDYSTGKITLNNFAPVGIDDALKRIKFFASPESLMFSSDKNSILTVDNDDQGAVSATATPVK